MIPGIGEAASAAATQLVAPVRKLFDRLVGLIPDKEAARQFSEEMERTLLSTTAAIDAAQSEINRTEAASANLFVSGWRPFIGWVCGSALAYQYILRPILPWACLLTGHEVPPLPGLDENLWQLMAGMLGLGGLRTYEKRIGVAREK